MALFIDVGPDDILHIGDMMLMVERKSGSRARLKLVGSSEVELRRKARLHEPRAAAAPLNPPRTDTGD